MHGEDTVDLVVVELDWVFNASDQIPVKAIQKVEKKKETSSQLLVCCKPKWDKYNKYKYKDFVSKHISRSAATGNFPGFDNLHPLRYLIYVLQLATRYNKL